MVRILEHQYTEAGLSFDNLKGKDLVIAELLKKTNKLQVYLAKITVNQSGKSLILKF